MKQILEAIDLDDVIFIKDSHIGQQCYHQANEFNKTVKIGSVIITKLDGHSKGGGALPIVEVVENSIFFVGNGALVSF